MRFSNACEINRGALANSLLALVGHPFRSMRLSEIGIELVGGDVKRILFAEIAGPAKPHRGFWFSTVCIPLQDGSEIRVVGFKPADIQRFVEAANQARHHFLSELFNAASEELQSLSQVVERLEHPRRYPSACLLQPFARRADSLISRLPKTVSGDCISAEQKRMFDAVGWFRKSPKQLRDAAIRAYVETDLAEMRTFFDSIEAQPLTTEQRLAVVTDEDATLVLAGAGSGKTSVIVAKATYLVERGIRRPDEILLLAFGRDAAAEMATRIEQRCGFPVDARTFHALGYEITRKVEGQTPALAPHASDDAQFQALLRDILLNDIATQDGVSELLLRWFTEFYRPYKSEWDFKTEDEYRRYVDANELRTLQGELVRSFEELEIANWLYLHGVAYEYEPLYEHPLPKNDRRAYTPDFRLTDSGVYIEHFGIKRERDPNGAVRLTTAPHVDRESYLEGMAWKRKVHQDHGTTLVETFSYERVEGRLFDALKNKLEPYATLNLISSEVVFNKLSQMGLVDAFTQTLGTFLRHFKGCELSIGQCRRLAEHTTDAPRRLAFLKIFERLIEAYESRLEGKIDFEDMIRRATAHVRENRYLSPYRHILVDEFQDMSDGRAKLLLALKAQHPEARIFAVGDDWQSIYRFTGSNIQLMRKFGQTFGGSFAGSLGVHSTIDLKRTFRSVDKIALPSRDFVLKNPAQIEKRVVPAETTDSPAIRVVYYTRSDEESALRDVLDYLQRVTANSGATSVLLLGRYQFVRPANLDELRLRYPGLAIRFMTVHRSKGLEADHVIILRAVSGRMGFPSKIVDDSLLDMVLPGIEPFEHAEERRLFYVALTRARTSVTVLSDRERPSVFVRELVDDGATDLQKLPQTPVTSTSE
jgi:DNA helicase-4